LSAFPSCLVTQLHKDIRNEETQNQKRLPVCTILILGYSNWISPDDESVK
jgi:hypothetical protein